MHRIAITRVLALMLLLTCLSSVVYASDRAERIEQFKAVTGYKGEINSVDDARLFSNLYGSFALPEVKDSMGFKANSLKIAAYLKDFYNLPGCPFTLEIASVDSVYVYTYKDDSGVPNYSYTARFCQYYNGFLLHKEVVKQPLIASYMGSPEGFFYVSFGSKNRKYSLTNELFVSAIYPPKPEFSRQQALDKVKEIITMAKPNISAEQLKAGIHLNNQILDVYHDEKDVVQYLYYYEFYTDINIGLHSYRIDAITGEEVPLNLIGHQYYKSRDW